MSKSSAFRISNIISGDSVANFYHQTSHQYQQLQLQASLMPNLFPGHHNFDACGCMACQTFKFFKYINYPAYGFQSLQGQNAINENKQTVLNDYFNHVTHESEKISSLTGRK